MPLSLGTEWRQCCLDNQWFGWTSGRRVDQQQPGGILLTVRHWNLNTLRPQEMPVVLQTFSTAVLDKNLLYFVCNFTEGYSDGSSWQEVIIDAGNGLAPNRCQAISCTNDDPIKWWIHASLSLNIFRIYFFQSMTLTGKLVWKHVCCIFFKLVICQTNKFHYIFGLDVFMP